MFQTKIIKKIKTHLILNNFLSENRTVYGTICRKYGRARKATDDDTVRRRKISHLDVG